MDELRSRRVPTVFDGDAIHLVARRPSLLAGHAAAVLTPNAREFAALWAAWHAGAAPLPPVPADAALAAEQLLRRLHAVNSPASPGNVALLVKGLVDAAVAVYDAKPSVDEASVRVDGSAAPVSDKRGALVALVASGGSQRRCGGQGDVLAGALGTFLAWAARGGLLRPESTGGSATLVVAGDASHERASAVLVSGDARGAPQPAVALVAASAAAARLVRAAASRSFAEHGRSATTPDLLAEVGRAFAEEFPGC